MKLMNRNCRTVYYCLFVSKTALTDSDGYETGESKVTYGNAIAMQANVSAASGYAQTEVFGNLEDYDKVIVTADTSCPIDENSVLFVDKVPEFEAITGKPIYDYTVRRVAKSLNYISIAVRKVKIS